MTLYFKRLPVDVQSLTESAIPASFSVSYFVQVVTPEMKEFMKKLREKVVVALVGGSDFPKLEEQMGGDNGKISLKIYFIALEILAVHVPYWRSIKWNALFSIFQSLLCMIMFSLKMGW